MAGTTLSVKRQWGISSTLNAIRAFYTTINNIITDLETLRSPLAESNILIEELHDDAATMRTEILAIGTTLADFKAIYDAHTHECSNSAATAARCSTPDTGAAENSLTASSASAFTDTSGSSVPATLTAGKPTSSEVNAAGDLIAPAISTIEQGD